MVMLKGIFLSLLISSYVSSSLVEEEENTVDWSEFNDLTHLSLEYESIKSLKGIERLGKSLTSLNLKGNQIEDIDPIGHLTKLTYLDLSNNKIGN
jgi:Leucine-rich repeat (LRR) protein